MQSPEPASPTFEPRRPTLIASLVFLIPVAILCWPILQGYFLGGGHSDQYVAGFSFREFGAEHFRATGSIPQWNPYLFGGMPFIAASSGDIFYPTAWLRWIMPTGTAMALGFAVHLLLAGIFAFMLLRALRCSWGGAVVGGLAYELSGIVASMVHPGHDGKLFVSALAPLLLLALLRAIRDQRQSAFGLVALVVGLCILTPHPQMTYYLLIAAGLWTLYLVFRDPERPAGLRWPAALGFSTVAVVVGVGIGAVFVLPFLSYFPFSPRVVGESATSWEYATGYGLPLAELVGTVLPQFNGFGPEAYWGNNFFKAHSEYLGAMVVVLAALGIAAWRRQRALLVLAGIAVLFLLVSLGSDTPFYRLWYEVMPFMKKVRAPGMAFFLVALPVSAFAAFGADRLLRREISPKSVVIAFGTLGVFALLGFAGVLQSIAEGLAHPQMLPRAMANEPALIAGSLRLLAVAVVGGAVAWAVTTGRLRAAAAAALLALAVGIDLWSIERRFFVFEASAEELYAEDPITAHLASQPKPYRVFDMPSQSFAGVPSVYPGSYLMAHDVQAMFGYHGNEINVYDELWGGKNVYSHLGSLTLWDLWGVRFAVFRQDQPVPGFHRVLGPVATTPGDTAYLFERDSATRFVRVVPGALKLPEERIIPTLVDSRFPTTAVVLFPDSAAITPKPLEGRLPAPTTVTARVAEWAPGEMTVAIEGADTDPTYLVIGETWYPDWHATVDGAGVPVHRGNFAQLSLELPPGAREVRLWFASPAYVTGKIVSLVSLLLALAAVAVPLARERRRIPHKGL